MRPNFLHLVHVPERCFGPRRARVASWIPGCACGWVATSCPRAVVLQSSKAVGRAEASPQVVKIDSSRLTRLLHEDAVSQRPRRPLTAAVADHASAPPRADVTQVARPCSHAVWMVDVNAIGNRKQLEMEEWRGLHVFRRPGSPQMAGPLHRSELDVRSVRACHASTNHGVARSFTVVGWSEPSRHARPDSAPSRPRQHHL